MKGPSPAFQFYPKDWLSDGLVRQMTHEQKGVYMDLLSIYWLEGGLPSDISRLARLVGVSAKRFERLWAGIAECFQRDSASGTLGQRRLDEEKAKQIAYRQLQAEKGSIGGKSHGINTEKKPRLDHGLTPASFRLKPEPSSSVLCSLFSVPSSPNEPTDTSTDLSPSAPSSTPEIMVSSKALARTPRNGTRVSPEAVEVAGRYLQAFNAVYSRRLGLVPKLLSMVQSQLQRGSAPWQVVALPVMVAGRQPSWRPEADHLLRDGSHKHTGPNGQTSGDTDWLAREMLSLDRLVLDARLAGIAQAAGVLDRLTALGVGLRKEEL